MKLKTVAPRPAFTYREIIDRWVDGDTVILAIDRGFSIWSHQIVRLLHINAPEMKTPEGPKSLAALLNRAPVGSTVMAQTHLDRVDNWHRILADVWTDVDPSQSLSECELANGWAVPLPAVKGKR